jgi:hypothetical protein
MHSYKTEFEDLKKELEIEYKLNKKMLEDPTFKNKVKSVVNEWTAVILHKSVNFNQYENLSLVIDRLKS